MALPLEMDASLRHIPDQKPNLTLVPETSDIVIDETSIIEPIPLTNSVDVVPELTGQQVVGQIGREIDKAANGGSFFHLVVAGMLVFDHLRHHPKDIAKVVKAAEIKEEMQVRTIVTGLELLMKRKK